MKKSLYILFFWKPVSRKYAKSHLRLALPLLLFASLTIAGCWPARLLVHNIGESITGEPEKIRKFSNPVHDSVKVSVLMIGHSATLVQIYDKVIMFDPFFNKRFGGVLMRRTEPGLRIDSLKQLDVIFVSHSHMDHLSYSSLDMLTEKFPNSKIVFPEGTENYLPDYKVSMIRVNKADTRFRNFIGRPVYVSGMKVTPVFAYHNGGRYGFDTYTWREEGATGFIVEYKDVTFYYAGDTGYHDTAFKQIGEKFDIGVSLIPIGPCRNCDSTGFWHHTSSIEALELFKDIKAEYMIPVHYGTVKYFTDENKPLYVLNELVDSLTAYKPLKDKIIALKPGEQKIWKETGVTVEEPQ